MRSPEAVFEVNAYQEALPHWAEAVPVKAIIMPAAMVAAAIAGLARFFIFWLTLC
ncbi:hypothetical protein [Aminobacter aminovorans]|uniref:hypothetical protein n=1 Tax=Aminobacter aminovorans TaxID=83263 RepID=UPI0031ED1190